MSRREAISASNQLRTKCDIVSGDLPSVDTQEWGQSCQACQRSISANHQATLPVGHVPVERPYQRVSVDLVEYKTPAVVPRRHLL